MTRTRFYPLAIAALFLTACADTPTQPDAQGFDPQLSTSAAPSTHIVDFNGRGPANFAERVAAAGGSVLYANADAGFGVVTGLTDEAAAALGRVQGVGAVLPDVEIQLATQSMDSDVDIDAVEVNSVTNPAGALRFSWQWNMRAIGANTAWSAGELGSSTVTVAILDTGIDYTSRDMVGMVDLSRSASFIPSDDALLTNPVLAGRHPVDDFHGHGTNVATQVASNGDVHAGVTSRTRLIGVKVLGRTGSGSLASILAGLAHAADVGADVANMSLGVAGGVSKIGNGQFVGVVNKAFNYAHRQGMVVVVSAGNNTLDLDSNSHIFRAYCDGAHVVCVSALGPTASVNLFTGPFTNVDALAPYSNFGQTGITVSAPGGTTFGYVWSMCPRNRITAISATGTLTRPCAAGNLVSGYAGTSQAAPHVAGLAALVVAHVGANNPSTVVHALTRGADDLGPAGRDDSYGAGRINVPATIAGL